MPRSKKIVATTDTTTSVENLNWTKKGNKYNRELPESIMDQVKQEEHQRTVGRILQDRIAKYPETLTEADWLQWKIVRPLLVGRGAYYPTDGVDRNKKAN